MRGPRHYKILFPLFLPQRNKKALCGHIIATPPNFFFQAFFCVPPNSIRVACLKVSSFVFLLA